MIIVFFGQPHSGKTTLANALSKEMQFYKTVDGDQLRDIFQNKDYSKEGRIKNLNRASDIAHYLNETSSKNTNIILSLVYPYKEARGYLNNLTNDIKWIYLTYNEPRGRENFHVEDFDKPIEENFLKINTSQIAIDEAIELIKKYIHESLG